MLSFVLIDLLTGRIAADLIDLEFGGALKATMGRSESVSCTLPLSSAPAEWQAATVPYTSAIICLDDDGVTPVWGGIIDDRETSEGSDVPLSLVSAEGYFDRRFVGDVVYVGEPQNLMIQDLIQRFVATGRGNVPGINFRVQIEGGNGVVRDRTFADKDDKTVLSVLQDLSGLDGGPEWCVEWERPAADPTLITPVLRVGDRLGSTPPIGLGPAVQFAMPGNVQKATFKESYKSGVGANDVMAVSSGTQDARPQSEHITTLTANRPLVEYRWTPSTSITDVNTLNGHAASAFDAISEGAQTLTLTANRYRSQHLGSEWRIGDTVGFDLTSDAWPDGLTGTARVIGWEIDETTVTPIVLVDPYSVVWGQQTPPVAGKPFTLTDTWTATDNGDGTWTATGPLVINRSSLFNINS